ncbi:MAG: hypothetical protein IJD37_00620 [Clostridia bacterium]|nr:hypothetical protein [Clostridia bacterium]
MKIVNFEVLKMEERNIIEKGNKQDTPQNIVFPLKSVKKNESVLLYAEEKEADGIEDGVM